MKKDVGVAKRFSKKYGNKWRAFNNSVPAIWNTFLLNKSYAKMPVNAWCYIPIHHCLQNIRQYFTIWSWIQELDTKSPVARLAEGGL